MKIKRETLGTTTEKLSNITEIEVQPAKTQNESQRPDFKQVLEAKRLQEMSDARIVNARTLEKTLSTQKNINQNAKPDSVITIMTKNGARMELEVISNENGIIE